MKKHREFKSLDRRRFIGSSMIGAAALSAGCSSIVFDREPGEKMRFRARRDAAGVKGPDPLPPTRVYPDMPDSVVGVRGITDGIEASVREAVLMAGGLDEIEKGQTVVVKPNMCGPALNNRYPKGRITTHPEVLRAVIRIVKEKGARVIVGDRAMFMSDTAFVTSGFSKICKEEGVEGYSWKHAEYVRFHPNKRHWSEGFRYPKILRDADHFINVPLLKHHFKANITCCMKAYVGVCLPLDRFQEGTNALHTANIAEKIAELNLCVKPTINIVDATQICIDGGPDGMQDDSRWADANLILASKDRVACESVAMSVLKRYGGEAKVEEKYVNMSVWDEPQIYYAAELGMGQADPSRITIEDVNVKLMDEFKANWK